MHTNNTQGYNEPHYEGTYPNLQQQHHQNPPQHHQQSPVQVQVISPVQNQKVGLLQDQGFHSKHTPIAFYIVLICGIIEIITGISVAASGNAGSLPGPLITGIILILIAFSIRYLEIRGDGDHLYIGWGPLQWCGGCCLQKMNLQYSDIDSYYQRPNRCWYPIGYYPGYWDKHGNDCCRNIFCRGNCCCTNTWFYNSACVCCCFVTVRDLVVLKLRHPIHCCCHTLENVAVSVHHSGPLSNYLSSHGIRNGDQSVMLQVNVTHTPQQQVIHQPQQQQYMAPPQHQQEGTHDTH